MTKYSNWKVGDVINICTSVSEFCSQTLNFIRVYDINVTKFPDSCTVNFGTGGSCGIHLNNVELTFSFIKGSPNTSDCSTKQTYKILGSVRTVSNGTAGVAYTVTEQDRLDYIAANNEGYSYYVMVCITDSDGQVTATYKAMVTTPITIIESHLECVSGVCTKVSGAGTNTCNTVGSTTECASITATHYIEYDFSIFPSSFIDLVRNDITYISNMLVDYLPFPSNIQYIESKFEGDNFKIYVKYTEPLQLSMNIPYGINSLYELTITQIAQIIGGSLIFAISEILLFKAKQSLTIWGQVAAIIVTVVGAILIKFTIVEIFGGSSTPGTNPSKDPHTIVIEADQNYNNQIAKCNADFPCVSDNTCTSVQQNDYDICMMSAAIIRDGTDGNMSGTSSDEMQANLSADLAKLTNRQTNLTNGLITVAQAKALLDAQLAEFAAKAAAAAAATTCNTGFTYNPDTKSCVKIEDCAIRNPFGGCILSSKTGTTILYIGGGLLIGYIGYKILVKK